MTTRFADRRAAGQALGERLSAEGGRSGDTVVLGLPRGGVLVAAGVAAALAAPLDVLVVRKLGLPWQPELAMGAIAAVGDAVETVRVSTVLAAAGVDPETFERVRQQEIGELRRRETAYRDGRPPVAVAGRSVIVVDDGLATGATMHAAVVAVRHQAPLDITAAVPVGSPSACAGAGRGRRRPGLPVGSPGLPGGRPGLSRTSPRPPTPRSEPPSPTRAAPPPDAARADASAPFRGPAVPWLTDGPRLGNHRLCEPVHKVWSGSWRAGRRRRRGGRDHRDGAGSSATAVLRRRPSSAVWGWCSDVPHITARVRPMPARNVIVLTVGCR